MQQVVKEFALCGCMLEKIEEIYQELYNVQVEKEEDKNLDNYDLDEE
ncbi:29079_t:CDS:2 [Gigaspora margarita]|uniref:29079_t:CDS:1 n=1 Tax=Gigaspora margarita TaxID=4874 RepID=A0ABN7VT11_GIGMA|nr:29079_t:CDS:2 [Gigaspora margarita]